MLNKVMLLGRLGADPKLNRTQGGQPVCRFSLATSMSYTDKNGQKVEQTAWHHIVAFGKRAEVCHQYLHKGNQVFIEGSLSTRKWQDENGQDGDTGRQRPLYRKSGEGV